MIVSIFGDITYGDRPSLLTWGSAHDVAHRVIKQSLNPFGANIQSVILGGDQFDDDWFGMHGLTHVAISRSIQGVTSESAALLATDVSDWDTEGKFKIWHQNHDRLHEAINQALGIPS